MTRVGGIAADQLKMFIEKIETLEQQKAEIAEEVRGVFAEAKYTGFDIKTMRQIIKIRKMDSQQRTEEEEMLDLYKHALGIGIPKADADDLHAEMGKAA